MNKPLFAHGSFLVAALLFFIVAGHKATPAIRALQGWGAWDQPAAAADFLEAMYWGAGAFVLGVTGNAQLVIRALLARAGVALPTSTPSEPPASV